VREDTAELTGNVIVMTPPESGTKD